ncbi:acyl-CoA dehydrogenase family protein [Natrinema halophilum]|uniref:acyl-CoA dehydrogenase family protein n=1 Tax=Natrinema halophilum TaxID=1699371 RepID=UPI001F40CCA8|nr:acyl-CoA dehydrogenase family protein [Natrinema halophilum]UHQ96315.1 acyl-CoA/acyl-ACP dehydrogenase [Natrinema halophilum]
MEENLRQKVDECGEVLKERSVAVDQEGEFPAENFELLHEKGLLALGGGTDYGGYDAGPGGDYRLFLEVLEEFARACANTAHSFGTHSVALATIKEIGTEEQHAYFTEQVAENGDVFGFYATEPEVLKEGTSFAEFDTTASRVDGGWEVNGVKGFATNSTYANYHMVYAIEEGGDMSDIRLLVVEDDADGLTIKDTWDSMGQRATASGLAEFDGVFVPDDHAIGGPGDISAYAHIPQSFALIFGMLMTGIAQSALDFTKWYLENESKPPANLPSLSHDEQVQLRVGDMRSQIEAARQLNYWAGDRLAAFEEDPDLGQEASKAIKIAKVTAADTSVEAATRMFQVCGARATSERYRSGQILRNARTLSLEDIVDKQKGDIAKIELGVESDGGRYG